MKVLVCGSRAISDAGKVVVKREMEKHLGKFQGELAKFVLVLHGAAAGVDSYAAAVAEEHGWKVLAFPPNTKKYGKVCVCECSCQSDRVCN